MAEKVIFSGNTHEIWIKTGVTDIDVQLDMYSPWKEWVMDNPEWTAAFRTFGGDPTTTSQFAPRYFFLINGWRVIAKNVSVSIQTNLYSEDYDSPFIVINAAVTNRTSDVPVIKSELEQRLDYGDRVYYDEGSIYSGIIYPVGTIAQPVNNPIDAMSIASPYNINKFYSLGDINLPGISGQTFQNMSIIADKENLTATLYGNKMDNMEWISFIIDGNFSGGTNQLTDCNIVNALDISGDFKECKMNGLTRIWDNLNMFNCSTGLPHPDNPITYDMNANRITKFSNRAYSGSAKICNLNTSGSTSTLDLISGKIILNSSCTDGYINIRGVGYLIDNSSGTTVNTTGFVDSFETYIEETREIEERLAYSTLLYYDANSGFTGTTYPIGTIVQPVNNIFDLFTLTNDKNIKHIAIKGDLIITGWTGNLIIGYTLESYHVGSSFSIYDGEHIQNLKMINLFIYGDFKGGYHQFEHCKIMDVDGISGHFNECGLFGNLTISNNSTFTNCHTDIADTSPHLYFDNSSGLSCAFRNYSGGINIIKMEHPNDKLTVDLNSGKVIIHSGCTEGFIDVRGVGYIEDHSGDNCVVKRDGFIQATPGEYDGVIVLDVINGISGTIYPIGSEQKPVNNITDAISLLSIYSLSTIKIIGSLTIDDGEDISGVAFTAERSTGNYLSITSAVTDYTYIENLTTNIIQNGACRYTTSVLVNIDNFDGGAKDCLLVGNINIVGLGSNYFTNCDTYTTDVDSLVEIDVGDKKLNIIRCRGFYKITNKTSTNNTTIDMVGGRIEIDNTCVSGSIYIAGICEVIDNSSSGCTIIRDSQLQSSPGEYDNEIVIDTINGIPGVLYPIGTAFSPVDNLSDALILLSTYSLSKIRIIGSLTIDSGEDISGVAFTAERSTGNYLSITSAVTDYTYIEDLTTSVVQSGTCRYTTSVLVNIDNFDGGAKNCLLIGNINIVGNGNNYFTDCDTYTTDVDSLVSININDKKLNMIRSRGFYKITNKTSTNDITLDMVGGKIEIDSTCVSGSIYIAGICEVIDNSSSGCTIIRDSQLQSSPGEYDDVIVIDVINGYPGVLYPIGTNSKPVNNLADALSLMDYYQLDEIKIVGSITIDGGEDISGIAFTAERSTGNYLFITSAVTDHTYIENLTTNVIQSGTCRYTTSVILGVTNFDGGAKNCLLIGNINIVGNGNNYFTDCDTYTTDVDSSIEIDVGDKNLNMIRGRGLYKITNKTSTNDITIDMVAGTIEIDSTCVSGSIYVAGICEVVDNSSSECDVQVHSMSHTAISQNVWDEPLTAALHNKPTSAGKRLRGFTSMVIRNELSQGAGVNDNQIILDIDAEDWDGAYDPAIVTIIGGTGEGQTRLILQYSGSTKTATVDRNWKVNPDSTSEYAIIADAGREQVNDGLARSGTTNTITLNIYASSINNAYKGQIIFIRSGKGEDQAKRVISYDGVTKIVTVDSSWSVIPNKTSAYVMLPTATITHKLIADAVWDATLSDHLQFGSAGDALNNVSAGASPQLIAEAVWNQQLSGFTTHGSAGYSLGLLVDADSGVTSDIKRILGLTQENFLIKDHIYDTEDLLESATIRIFNNSTDTTNDTNPLAEYSMTALYDSGGRLTNYKVIKN